MHLGCKIGTTKFAGDNKGCQETPLLLPLRLIETRKKYTEIKFQLFREVEEPTAIEMRCKYLDANALSTMSICRG